MSDGSVPGVIGGRYETVRLIGRGGMGSVWLAKDRLLGREVAVKQITALPGESEREAERALREARSAAALNHPNVVALYDALKHEGASWLVMEYVAGPTLAAWVRKHGPAEPAAVAEIGARLAGGLVAAHRAGIVHRDIKPANVFMGDDGEPKIGDFGTARGGDEDGLTLAGVVTGTPSYMAPEVAEGGDHTEAADVWALGATLYFAVEGQDAYPGTGNALATLREIATKPPRSPGRAGELQPVLAQMLAHNPDRRGSMRDAMRQLEEIAPGRAGAIPMVGAAAAATSAGAGASAAAATSAADEDTDALFVSQETEATGLFGFPGVPAREAPAPGRRHRPVLAGAVTAVLVAGLGVAAFTLGGDEEGEATPPASSTTSSSTSSTPSSSKTSSSSRTTSETTTEEVAPPPPPAPEPPPEPAPEPTTPQPQRTTVPPPPATTSDSPSSSSEMTSETPESTSETSSESSSETSSETSPESSEPTSETPEPSEPAEPSDPTSEFTPQPPSEGTAPESGQPTSGSGSSAPRAPSEPAPSE